MLVVLVVLVVWVSNSVDRQLSGSATHVDNWVIDLAGAGSALYGSQKGLSRRLLIVAKATRLRRSVCKRGWRFDLAGGPPN